MRACLQIRLEAGRRLAALTICGLAVGGVGCSTAQPAVDLRAELSSRRPAWRPAPVGAQEDGRLVLGGVAGPATAGVVASDVCGEAPSGDLWHFPGNPEVALTVGWGDAPASLVHAPRPGCVATVALLPGGIPGGLTPKISRREVFATCDTGSKAPPVFGAISGEVGASFGVDGFSITGLGYPGTVAAAARWEQVMCGSGTVAIAYFATDRGHFVQFSLEYDQSGEVANQQVAETLEVKLTAAGPVVLARAWSQTSSWGEEGESEELETGEASLGWIWGETVVLRTEGFRKERAMDRDCETWSLAEYGSWTLNEVTLDQYDELDGGETPECTQPEEDGPALDPGEGPAGAAPGPDD